MKPLFTGYEWNDELLVNLWTEIEKIAKEDFKLDYYPVDYQIVSYEQMIDIGSTSMPQMYNHWSFGKSYLAQERAYRGGIQGLAYEVIFNTNPSVAYLEEQNTATCQALVMAHAGCGHGSFFKTNYLFKHHTQANYILEYLDYSKNYIAMCEQKYGAREVEELLDICHVFRYHCIDKTKRPHLNKAGKKMRSEVRDKYTSESYDEFWHSLEKFYKYKPEAEDEKLEVLDEENLLYFVEKHSKSLAPWQKEIVRIVRKIQQYFYPQILTKTMNEGWATFIHSEIMLALHDKGIIDSGSYLEFLQLNCGVTPQRDYDDPRYSGFNPYAIGWAIFKDIKRICVDPTDEDRHYFPQFAGNPDWLSVVTEAMTYYNDESFVLQYLSPKLIREFKLMVVDYDSKNEYNEIVAIQNEEDYKRIKKALSLNYNHYSKYIPRFIIKKYDDLVNHMTVQVDMPQGMQMNKNELDMVRAGLMILMGENSTVFLYGHETVKEK